MSLLPIFSKILDKLLHLQISSYIDESNILNEQQFGFRKNHGTHMPIAHLTNQLFSSLEEDFITCVLYLDLKKAFDTISLNILLDKIAFIRIKGKSRVQSHSRLFCENKLLWVSASRGPAFRRLF